MAIGMPAIGMPAVGMPAILVETVTVVHVNAANLSVGKATSVHAWTGPEVSRSLGLQDFWVSRHMKVVSWSPAAFTHRKYS